MTSRTNLPNNIDEWEKWLEEYQPKPSYPDDFQALETCKLALQAVKFGNFGIGCILVNPAGEIVVKGHNKVFNPYFRSDYHGEMVVMDMFEDDYKDVTTMKGYKLYTSLESCPMCMARLITSGCETVLYVAGDRTGGMVHLKENLPEVWKNLAKRLKFGIAECSEELREAANEIFLLNVKDLNDRLIRR